MILKALKLIAICAATILLLSTICVYATYAFLASANLIASGFTWSEIAAIAPLVVLGFIVISLALSTISAFGIRFLSYKKGTKHFTVTMLRWLFLASIGGIMISFFISLVFLQHYLLVISEHYPHILCVRVTQEMLSPNDIYLFLKSADACQEFKAGQF